MKGAASETASGSDIDYFLAMTEHHLGNPEAAQKHLSDANASAETELAASPGWNRRLTIELLRSEATALVAPGVSASKETQSDEQKASVDGKQ